MYHLDHPGGPSRPRHLQTDISRADWGQPSDASRPSRVDECSCSDATRGRNWAWRLQTMYDVGLYGSALKSAYRLLRMPPQATAIDPIFKTPDRSQTGRTDAGKGIRPILQTSDEGLQAALGEALASSIATTSPPEEEGENTEALEPEIPLRPLAQWSQNNPGSRRRRNDPSRLSRVSYISTMSTQSSTFSSIDSEWDGNRDRDCESTPESLYILTPPAPYVGLPSTGRNAKFVEPKTPLRLIGLGLSLGEGEEGEEGNETVERLDALLAKVQELTKDGMRALEMGPTRIHAGLPGKASTSRRKLHTSLD